MGIGKDRLNLAWVSSAEAQRFVEIATRTIETVRNLGPFNAEEYKTEITAAEMTVNMENVRWLVGKEVKITSKGDVYGRSWSIDDYEALLDTTLEREFHKNLIFLAIDEGYSSVREISERTGLDLKRVSYLLADLEKTGRAAFTGMKESKPAFAAL